MPLARHPRKGQEGDPLYIYLAKMREISWMCVPNCNDMWYRVSPSPLPASMKPRAPTSNGAVPPKHLCMPVNNWDPSCPGSIASVMVACCSKACTLFPEVDAYSPLKRWLSWVKKQVGLLKNWFAGSGVMFSSVSYAMPVLALSASLKHKRIGRLEPMEANKNSLERVLIMKINPKQGRFVFHQASQRSNKHSNEDGLAASFQA